VKRFFGLFLAVLTVSGTISAQAVTLPTTVITFNSIPRTVYGSPAIQLNISATAGLTTVTSNTPSICSVTSNNTVQLLSAGVCKLTATNPGTANYKPARAVTRSFSISKAPNVISFSEFNWLSMAYPNVELTTTQTSGITFLSSTSPATCSISDNVVHAIKLGKCSIRAVNSGDTNYLAAKSVIKTVTISQTSVVPPPAISTGPWTIRQQTFNDANSASGLAAANSWVAAGWYQPGLDFRIAQVQALGTTNLQYKVTDSMGRAVANKVVYLSVGKRFAGSNARVRVGTQNTSGSDIPNADQLLVSATTDSNGLVSFAITGLDAVARAGLYTQVAAWVTDLGQDIIDITNLEYSIPANSSGGNSGGNTDQTLVAPSGVIDSLFYQPCSGITLLGQIANIDLDPVDRSTTVLAVTRGRADAPSGIWDYSVLATLPRGNFTSAANRTVTVQVYSPRAGVPILLRLQNGRIDYTKFIETRALTTRTNQWETLTFDFNNLSSGSQQIDSATSYTTLSLIADAGNASTGQKYYFKNFSFPGALIPANSLTTTSTNPLLSAAAGSNNGYLWSEEFNGASGSRPNSANWKYALDWNNFIQGTAPDLVELDGNGNLAIGMQKCSDGSWNGGIIHTLGKTAFLYGKMEARIKIASDPGWFSAFYMFGEDVAHWPTCGEFDIQESGPWTDFGSSGTIHGNYPGTTTDWNNGGGFMTPVSLNRGQLSSGYHTYGLQWTPTSIEFTLDGSVYKRFTKADVLRDGGTWPFDVPEFVVYSIYPFAASLPANAALGTVLRGQVLVDWIRYSQYQGYGQVFNR
jgi:beta-glucanase (GH16 family)